MTWRATNNIVADASGRINDHYWIGLGNDAGRYLWYDTDLSNWFASTYMGMRVRVDSTYGAITWLAYNDARVYQVSTTAITSGWLWYDGAQWVITEALGVVPTEFWDFDASGYVGADWYSSPTFEGDYDLRGAGRGTTRYGFEGTAVGVIYEVEGWKRDTAGIAADAPAGRYSYYKRSATISGGTATETITTTAPSGTDEYVYVGTPVWKDQNDIEYKRSAAVTDGYYTYGAIHHDGTGWVIGTRDTGGWWSGSEPDQSTPVTFTAQGDATVNKTVTFHQETLGSEKTSVLLAEVGRWL